MQVLKKIKLKRKNIQKLVENDGKIGESRGGLTSKIHAVVDGRGKPIKFILTPGNIHDSSVAISLLKDTIKIGVRVLGDKAYDAAKILAYIAYRRGIACIPPRKNKAYPQKYNKKAYKNRNKIECFFNRLKNFRRVATRYDKLPSSFFSFVYISSTLVILPKFPEIV